jgi:DNA-binding IclR family transcriptional regulator
MSDQVQRILTIVEIMVGKEANGITTGQIAAKSQQSKPNVSRALNELKSAGWVEPHPQDLGRYRLTHKLAQMSNTISMNLSQSMQQLSADQQNYNKIF